MYIEIQYELSPALFEDALDGTEVHEENWRNHCEVRSEHSIGKELVELQSAGHVPWKVVMWGD